jgi:hypothetical protein
MLVSGLAVIVLTVLGRLPQVIPQYGAAALTGATETLSAATKPTIVAKNPFLIPPPMYEAYYTNSAIAKAS